MKKTIFLLGQNPKRESEGIRFIDSDTISFIETII